MSFTDDVKLLQRFSNVIEDGVFGPITASTLVHKLNLITDHGPSMPLSERSEKCIATLLPPVQERARKLVQLSAQSGVKIEIISGTRTYAEQDALYQQGRSKPGKIITNARPGSSWHNHGCAFDIGVFRDGNYIEDGPDYRVVGQLGKSLGLEWGGDWAFVDEPHFQDSNGKNLAQARALHEEGKTVFS